MALRLVLSAASGQYQAAFAAMQQQIATAATAAIAATAAQVKTAGRNEIGSAGFSRAWQNTFRVNLYPPRGISSDPAAYAYHAIPYAGVFETGATIRGSPFLWLPLPATPRRVGGRRVTPAVYTQSIGPLHLMRRGAGKAPLLGAYTSAAPAPGKRATAAQLRRGQRNLRRRQAASAFGGTVRARAVSIPLFVGVPAAHLRKRFDLTGVFRAAGAALPGLYATQIERLNAQ
jgi:Family of unknown function (DUF6441)